MKTSTNDRGITITSNLMSDLNMCVYTIHSACSNWSNDRNCGSNNNVATDTDTILPLTVDSVNVRISALIIRVEQLPKTRN